MKWQCALLCYFTNARGESVGTQWVNLSAHVSIGETTAVHGTRDREILHEESVLFSQM
jgi:hypothetical protein